MTKTTDNGSGKTFGAIETLSQNGNAIKFPLNIMSGLLGIEQRSKQVDEQENRQHQQGNLPVYGHCFYPLRVNSVSTSMLRAGEFTGIVL
jgi:hypothetical protein